LIHRGDFVQIKIRHEQAFLQQLLAGALQQRAFAVAARRNQKNPAVRFQFANQVGQLFPPVGKCLRRYVTTVNKRIFQARTLYNIKVCH
jgi:hypothetical protein